MRADEFGLAAQHLDLALLGERRQAIREPADDSILPVAQPLAVDLRLAESDAELGHLVGFLDYPRGVQQRLRGDAADVQADAAERGPALDQRDLQAQIGRTE